MLLGFLYFLVSLDEVADDGVLSLSLRVLLQELIGLSDFLCHIFELSKVVKEFIDQGYDNLVSISNLFYYIVSVDHLINFFEFVVLAADDVLFPLAYMAVIQACFTPAFLIHGKALHLSRPGGSIDEGRNEFRLVWLVGFHVGLN